MPSTVLRETHISDLIPRRVAHCGVVKDSSSFVGAPEEFAAKMNGATARSKNLSPVISLLVKTPRDLRDYPQSLDNT